MSETRKLTTILAADVAGFSRLVGRDEEGTLRRLRDLRRDFIDPAIAANRGRVFKTMGDGLLIEFASVVDAARCAIAVQRAMTAHEADLAAERRIMFRVGIHLGDVVAQQDGDLLGDGVNIAARLEGIAEPGGICLSRAAHEQVEGKIAETVVDLGERELKNIARPMRVYAIATTADLHQAALRAASPLPASGGRLGGGPGAEPGPPRLSIVVLPFANLSGDTEQEYFVDGLTEDLTTELSRIPGAFVIARNTAFTYKGKPFDVKQIGRDLNVRYVLEGSVRRAAARVRVNAQLIDAETGAHLWADRFDRDIVDLFELQDVVTVELANVLGVQLIEAESRKSKRIDDPDVLDLLMQARAVANRGISREHSDQAARLYQRALERDPDNVAALGGLALTHANIAASLLSEDYGGELAQAAALARQALRIAPDDLVANYALAIALRLTGHFEDARRHLETVIRVNPSSRMGHNQYGWLLQQSFGDFAGSQQYFEKALCLSPRDPYRFIELYGLGTVHFVVHGDLERALEFYRRSYDVFPWTWTQLGLISGYARSGRMEEARRHLETYLNGKPIGNTIAMIRKSRQSDHPEYARQLEIFYEGLHRAGMPEE